MNHEDREEHEEEVRKNGNNNEQEITEETEIETLLTPFSPVQ